MEAKFTPGPWTCVRAGFNEDGTVRYTLEGVTEARIFDAHLIATAPEMYEALRSACITIEKCMDSLMDFERDRCLDELERIDVILARARGEA